MRAGSAFQVAAAALCAAIGFGLGCGRTPTGPEARPTVQNPAPIAPNPDALGPSALPTAATAAQATADAAQAPRGPSPDGALQLAFAATATDAALAALEAAMRGGVGHDDLRQALVIGHAIVASPASETEQLSAFLRLERALDGGERLEILLHMLARHRDALQRHGVAPAADATLRQPLRTLDKEGLQARLEHDFVAGARTKVAAALRVTFEEDGQESVSDALIRIAAAEDGAKGRLSVAAVSALRLLEATQYRDAGPMLERVGMMLPGGATAQPARRLEAQRLAAAFPGRFADGAPADPNPASSAALRDMAATLRGRAMPAAGDALLQEVRAALVKGEPAQALWDGLILAGHDLVGPHDPDGETFRLVHALRLVGERAPSSVVRAEVLLQAARRLGDAIGAAQVAPPPAPPAGKLGAVRLVVEVQREPDLGAVRRRLALRQVGDAARALAVAQIEASAMLAPDLRPDVEEPLHRWVLAAGTAETLPEAPMAEAGRAMIARLRAGTRP